MLISTLCVALLFGVCASCRNIWPQVPFDATNGLPIARIPGDEWQSLNSSVKGSLVSGSPVGLPCYNNFNGQQRLVDEHHCATVQANRNNTNFLTAAFGGYTQGNWGICQITGIGCPTSPVTPINASAPCNQGAIPDYYIDVQSVSDVQEGLRFATKHKIPVVVKNSGHDYKGRSAGPSALALWVHNYRPDPKLEENFIPGGCHSPVGDVITFGTGQDFNGLYEFAHKNDRTIAGGSAATVAPGGGWIGGGGHSGLSPVFGLGVDNVKQIRVVLPNGTYVTANHCQNQDIFFALRGGGGGTFGVNMEISMRAHPRVTLQYINMTFPPTLDKSGQRELLSVFVKNANRWFDAGWGGYAYPMGIRRRDYPVTLFNPLLSRSEAEESLNDLLAFAKSQNVTYQLTTYTSFYDLYLDNIKASLTEFGNYGLAQASRLIPRSNLDDPKSQTTLIDTITTSLSSTTLNTISLMLLLTTPSRSIPDHDSALTPAWRNSTWHVIYTTGWDPSTESVDNVKTRFRGVTKLMDPLRAITPNSGAYLNEGDTYEPDPISAFWGKKNYDRLVDIKDQLDPHKIMQVYQGIGSDPTSPRFDCYQRLIRDEEPRFEL